MITAPETVVVNENLLRHLPHRRLVGAAPPIRVTDDQIGADLELPSILVGVLGNENMANSTLSDFGIDDC